MSKKTAYIIVWTLGILLLLPPLVVGYGVLFGFSYNSDQISVTCILAVAGLFIVTFGSLIVSEVK